MKRMLCLLTLLSLSLPCFAFDQDMLMRVFFSIVLVRGYETEGGMAYGSGVVVGPEQVVTNCHVLRHTSSAWVSQGEDSFPISSVQADPYHDLCLLHVDHLPLKPVPLGSTQSIRHGEEIISIGHSNGLLGATTSGGQIKSIYPMDGGAIMRTNARFAMGASGSPLFDSRGNLIGINTLKTPGRTAFFYALPVEWLGRLAQLPAQQTLPISGEAFWEQPDPQKPYFMRTALPHLAEDWGQLQHIATEWTNADPGNPEAWYERGSAEEGLALTAAARASYQEAVRLDPMHGDALLRLGLLASRQGDHTEADRIALRLSRIDGTLADQLQQALRQQP